MIKTPKNFRKLRHYDPFGSTPSIKNFQDRLQQDLELMKPNKTTTFADKMTNIYRLTREGYDDKALNDSITTAHKKVKTTSKRKSMFLCSEYCVATKL